MARQHDAELCDRIRQLEERVRELEARPNAPTIVYPSYPQWRWDDPYRYPVTITYGDSTTCGGVLPTTNSSTV